MWLSKLIVPTSLAYVVFSVILQLVHGATLSKTLARDKTLASTDSRQPRALDLYEASIIELQSGLQNGHFTSVDLVKVYFARISQVNHAGPKLNAILETNPRALNQAHALDEECKHTGPRSVLHGIPILVKDSIATLASDGMNTTAGSYALLGSVVRGEATVVTKLRQAGAIILGKTNLFVTSPSANGPTLEATSQMAGQPEAAKPKTRTIRTRTHVARLLVVRSLSPLALQPAR
ncbi:amidase [Rhizoctonia solani AG-1 IB]|uniref:Amidase n=1 Tax=Thanatephorus cucumeris (strain AG1-IB / isolate 7/3/14) TaxID=1108050 RepID=M5BST0_THACB|nr:amidase [Rhizoctonia solani AG-1 IB]